ncbi:magnesium and cobalt transport protein CorA [Leucobacter luti]|uniref:Magnesium transporter n=1 Tax=Leucobacter luti TaxID=340320 RepID=A0A4Q7U5U7_9MICO|nr:magnesium and cobalt transport protein CorA [Leucobacter luti]MBL3700663.1 magnesium and cobalt transport protein CorA [Leucobacter luti]RZT68497.1 magnesium transporter [Leucobacter luti]
MSLVDVAVYHEGKRLPGNPSPHEARRIAAEIGGFAWVGLLRPGADELRELATAYELHPLAIEDVLLGKQRPKLEQYSDTVFMVLRPARYLDEPELVEFGELHLFVGDNFVITVRLAENPELSEVRTRIEAEPELLRLGPAAALYAILDRVVDDYEPVVLGLENDIAEIEDELFNGAGVSPELAKRIYLLSSEVIDFQRATRPLLEATQARHRAAEREAVDPELRRYLRDVIDHLIVVTERADGFRQLLRDLLNVHMGLVSQDRNDRMTEMTEISVRQSDQMKKISSWAAIIFAPTLISGIYGMNFRLMPELDWAAGYPLALLAMAGFAGALYAVFKKKDWL